MTLQFLSTSFIAIISTWAAWSVLSARVRDGIVGKVIYAVVAMAGYAMVTRSESIFITPTVAGLTFHGSLALAGIRHFFMATYWVRVRGWLCSVMSCERGLHYDDRREKVERRKL